MISKKSDDAVSPVIGVMLMLVVTVVIAAAVTIFATGVVGETEVAPVAVLDVDIIADTEALPGLRGPDFQVTHISGDPVDTADIEFRFSWTHDGCSHYSTFSLEGFEDADIQYTSIVNFNPAYPPLFVKSTMSGGSGGNSLDHCFGEVVLTPGLKLMTYTEALELYKTHTNSPFMDVIFDNYKVSTTKTLEKEIKKVGFNVQHSTELMKSSDGSIKAQYDPNCYHCLEANGGDPNLKTYTCSYSNGKFTEGYCHKCKNHPAEECSENNQHCIDKKCIKEQPTGNYIYTTGIMEHLQPGTAVDVMIVHIPSGKAIYDNTVIVQ